MAEFNSIEEFEAQVKTSYGVEATHFSAFGKLAAYGVNHLHGTACELTDSASHRVKISSELKRAARVMAELENDGLVIRVGKKRYLTVCTYLTKVLPVFHPVGARLTAMASAKDQETPSAVARGGPVMDVANALAPFDFARISNPVYRKNYLRARLNGQPQDGEGRYPLMKMLIAATESTNSVLKKWLWRVEKGKEEYLWKGPIKIAFSSIDVTDGDLGSENGIER